jgi:hypothetical protein
LIIWDTKWIHLKIWPTIKLHNFSRSTSSILIIYTYEAVYKIWILNFKTSHEFFNDKMILNKKLVNYKVSLHFKTYKFYFDDFSIRGSLKKTQILKFKHSFAWQDDFKPKHCQPQNFITFQGLQLFCWWFFHSTSFSKFVDFKWKRCQQQNGMTSQDLQSLFWLFGHLFISHDGSNIIQKILYIYLVVS